MVVKNAKNSVGVLALQGDFDKHLSALYAVNVNGKLVRTETELLSVDGLIIPGGESTAMTKLIKAFGLEEPLREFVKTRPVMGTCAGLILLSNQTESDRVIGFGAINIELKRNAFGRQLDSFSADISLEFDDGNPFHALFIRAPKILNTGEDVIPLATHKGETVMARNSNVLVTSFHPELTNNLAIHKYFINQLLLSKEKFKLNVRKTVR